MHAVLRRDEPGEISRASRRAHRIAAERAREANAVRGETVDVWRADIRIAVTAERPGALIIREDKDEIRPGSARSGEPAEGAEQGNDGWEDSLHKHGRVGRRSHGESVMDSVQ